jgi:hypothetical protein
MKPQRPIDANALKEYMDCGHLRNPCEVCFSELDVVNLIDAQPTIDAEPVRHAKLLNAHPYGECSNCGYFIDIREEFSYCPNCGCRMDVE